MSLYWLAYTNLTEVRVIREDKMEALIEKMKPRGGVEEKGDGIFCFDYYMGFQVIVVNELPAKEKAWLEALMEHH